MPFECLAWAWVGRCRSHCNWQYVRNTPTAASAYLAFLTSQSLIQSRDVCEIHTNCWLRISISSHPAAIRFHSVRSREVVALLALFLNFFSAADCAIACMHAFLSMDGLLAMPLMNNGEGSGDARLFVSETLQAPRVMKRNQSMLRR